MATTFVQPSLRLLYVLECERLQVPVHRTLAFQLPFHEDTDIRLLQQLAEPDNAVHNRNSTQQLRRQQLELVVSPQRLTGQTLPQEVLPAGAVPRFVASSDAEVVDVVSRASLVPPPASPKRLSSIASPYNKQQQSGEMMMTTLAPSATLLAPSPPPIRWEQSHLFGATAAAATPGRSCKTIIHGSTARSVNMHGAGGKRSNNTTNISSSSSPRIAASVELFQSTPNNNRRVPHPPTAPAEAGAEAAADDHYHPSVSSPRVNCGARPSVSSTAAAAAAAATPSTSPASSASPSAASTRPGTREKTVPGATETIALVTELDCSRHLLGEHGLAALRPVLVQISHSVRKLILCHCNLTNASAAMLCELLMAGSSACDAGAARTGRVGRLSNSGQPSTSLLLLSSAVSSPLMPRLQLLDLRFNAISQEGGKLLHRLANRRAAAAAASCCNNNNNVPFASSSTTFSTSCDLLQILVQGNADINPALIKMIENPQVEKPHMFVHRVQHDDELVRRRKVEIQELKDAAAELSDDEFEERDRVELAGESELRELLEREQALREKAREDEARRHKREELHAIAENLDMTPSSVAIQQGSRLDDHHSNSNNSHDDHCGDVGRGSSRSSSISPRSARTSLVGLPDEKSSRGSFNNNHGSSSSIPSDLSCLRQRNASFAVPIGATTTILPSLEEQKQKEEAVALQRKQSVAYFAQKDAEARNTDNKKRGSEDITKRRRSSSIKNNNNNNNQKRRDEVDVFAINEKMFGTMEMSAMLPHNPDRSAVAEFFCGEGADDDEGLLSSGELTTSAEEGEEHNNQHGDEASSRTIRRKKQKKKVVVVVDGEGGRHNDDDDDNGSGSGYSSATTGSEMPTTPRRIKHESGSIQSQSQQQQQPSSPPPLVAQHLAVLASSYGVWSESSALSIGTPLEMSIVGNNNNNTNSKIDIPRLDSIKLLSNSPSRFLLSPIVTASAAAAAADGAGSADGSNSARSVTEDIGADGKKKRKKKQKKKKKKKSSSHKSGEADQQQRPEDEEENEGGEEDDDEELQSNIDSARSEIAHDSVARVLEKVLTPRRDEGQPHPEQQRPEHPEQPFAPSAPASATASAIAHDFVSSIFDPLFTPRIPPQLEFAVEQWPEQTSRPSVAAAAAAADAASGSVVRQLTNQQRKGSLCGANSSGRKVSVAFAPAVVAAQEEEQQPKKEVRKRHNEEKEEEKERYDVDVVNRRNPTPPLPRLKAEPQQQQQQQQPQLLGVGSSGSTRKLSFSFAPTVVVSEHVQLHSDEDREPDVNVRTDGTVSSSPLSKQPHHHDQATEEQTKKKKAPLTSLGLLMPLAVAESTGNGGTDNRPNTQERNRNFATKFPALSMLSSLNSQ